MEKSFVSMSIFIGIINILAAYSAQAQHHSGFAKIVDSTYNEYVYDPISFTKTEDGKIYSPPSFQFKYPSKGMDFKGGDGILEMNYTEDQKILLRFGRFENFSDTKKQDFDVSEKILLEIIKPITKTGFPTIISGRKHGFLIHKKVFIAIINIKPENYLLFLEALKSFQN